MNLDFLLSDKKFLTVSLVNWSNDLPNFSIFSIIAGGTVMIWHPSCFACKKLYGSLTLAQSISTFLNLFENVLLFLNSGTGSLPVSPALPANIEIITLVFYLFFLIFF